MKDQDLDDVVINKIDSIKLCLVRIHEEYGSDRNSLDHPTKLDSITLNLQRACETCIDLAMYCVRKHSLGVPKSSREAFEKLQEHGIISSELCIKMKSMVGFRNIAIHQYFHLSKAVIQSIIEKDLGDFEKYIVVMKSGARA